jgi:hypothetical protein
MSTDNVDKNLFCTFGHGAEKWRMKEIAGEKKSFGDDGVQIAVKPCLRSCSNGIFWPFQTINVHKTLRGFNNPLHAAAENLHFVRGIEPPHCHVYGWYINRCKPSIHMAGLRLYPH